MMPLRGGLAPLTLPTYIPVSSWWLSGGVSASNAIAAYAPKGAADLAASYTNLANPGTYNAALGVAPTWNATDGWIFGGSPQHLRTGVIPQFGWTVIVAYSGLGAGADKALFGVYEGAAGAIAITGQTAAMRVFAGVSADYTPRLSGGVYAIANKTPYRNGVAETTIGAGGTTLTRQIYIGALNLGGTTGQYAVVNVQAFAIYNSTLTLAMVQAITTAINAL